MTELESIEACDRENFTANLELVNRIHSESSAALDAFPLLLDAVGPAFATSAGLADDERALGEWSDSVELPRSVAIDMLDKAALIGTSQESDTTELAKERLASGQAKWARLRLLQRLRRDYCFGAIDVLRNHMVSSMGYLRLQAETAAFLRMIARDPDVGGKWWHAITLEEGKRFHHKHSRAINETVEQLGLTVYYGIGSAMAMHSRSAGLVHGVGYGGEPDDSGDVIRIKMTYQDIDDSRTFFSYFANYLLAHGKIADSLPESLPEVSPELYRPQAESFRAFIKGVLATAREYVQLEGD